MSKPPQNPGGQAGEWCSSLRHLSRNFIWTDGPLCGSSASMSSGSIQNPLWGLRRESQRSWRQKSEEMQRRHVLSEMAGAWGFIGRSWANIGPRFFHSWVTLNLSGFIQLKNGNLTWNNLGGNRVYQLRIIIAALINRYKFLPHVKIHSVGDFSS